MEPLDCQTEYWDRIGPAKSFHHPVNGCRLAGFVSPDASILDYGCGYGRALGILRSQGFRNLLGIDPAPAMIARARRTFPALSFELMRHPPHAGRADGSVDAVLLFTVLTCVPGDEGQRAIVAEIARILRPAGVVYISDLWLQRDARNRARYLRDEPKYGRYGVFDLPEGATMRHHDRAWIELLTAGFDTLAVDDIDVSTMNGHPARGFQWFARKRSDARR